MKLSKNSLLVRMIFYNNIIIIFVSVTIAFFITFFIFQDIERKFITVAQDKMNLIDKNYLTELYIEKDDIKKIVTDNRTNASKFIREKYPKTNFVIIDPKKPTPSGLDFPIQSFKSIYFCRYGSTIYVRLISNYHGKFLVATTPIDKAKFMSLAKLSGLGSDDKIFFFVGNRYRFGDFRSINSSILRLKRNRNNIQQTSYIYKRYKIDGDEYYIVLKNIYNYKDRRIGTFGIAMSYENIRRKEFIIVLSTALITILFILMSIIISSTLFKSLLSPLIDIVDASEKFKNGNVVPITPRGIDELRDVATTYNEMIETIDKNSKKITRQNTHLREIVRKVGITENIYLNLNIYDDVDNTVLEIMNALVEKVGISRCAYFRYSRELYKMSGVATKSQILKPDSRCFEFQIKDFDRLVKLINIPIDGENIMARALINREIYVSSEPAYLQNLGNDFFQSLGINNFMIAPIYDKNRNYGCILLDNFYRDKVFSLTDIELMKTLFANINTKIDNKIKFDNKKEKEKLRIMKNFMAKFFSSHDLCLDTRQIKRIDDYVNYKLSPNFTIVDVGQVIDNIMDEIALDFEKENILISSLVGFESFVMGDEAKLKRCFYEIIRNAKSSFDKKLISTTKMGHITIKITRKSNTKLRIHIRDDGCGIADTKQIFEPFIGDKIGLGLTIASTIVREHGGVIKCHSKVGLGTDITVTFDIYKEEL